jgi:adenylate cyclase, class 2
MFGLFARCGIILVSLPEIRTGLFPRHGGEGESIPNEIEVKLSMTSVASARKKIAKLGAKLVRREIGGKDGRVHELNILFDTPDGGFARHGQLLRVRVESAGGAGSRGAKRAVLTYKGPGEPQKEARFKVRDEREVVVADDAAMRGILEALGLRGWFRYEKYRTTFALPHTRKWATGLHLELDETPIGVYLELEGPPNAIDRAAQELGFSRSEYITKNYLLLHVENCRRKGLSVSQLAPGVVSGIPDMLFAAAQSKSKRKRS